MSSIYENNRKWPMIECRVSDEEKKVMERIAEDMYSKRIIKYPTVTSFVKFAAKIMVKYYISEKQKEIAQKEAEVARLEEAESKTRIAAQKGPPPALQDLKEATNELFDLRKQLDELSSAYSSYQHEGVI